MIIVKNLCYNYFDTLCRSDCSRLLPCKKGVML
nr:MAG TPA: hypothetical protein [Caudoviricetes sp.]